MPYNNPNSWHRGAAHTDPYAPDRVMLILTWVPQPRSHAESRRHYVFPSLGHGKYLERVIAPVNIKHFAA